MESNLRKESANNTIKNESGSNKSDDEQTATVNTVVSKSEDDGDKFDAFGDGNNIFKKYQLRKPTPKMVEIEKKLADSDDELDLMCDVCKYEAPSKTGLVNHKRTHQLITKYTCSLCFKQFDSNKELVKHKKDHDADDRTFLCKKCKSAFTNYLDYLIHDIIHIQIKPIKCKECGKRYGKKSGYKIHIQTHFDRSFECHICKASINGEEHFKAHLYIHNRVCVCGECGRQFNSSTYLKYHMLAHTGVKPFQCLYCGKGFISSQNRQIHTRRHTGKLPFECSICSRQFKQYTDHKQHLESHSGKKYQCDDCKKMFTHKNSLIQHIRIHTKRNLYQCLECEKSCITRASLRSHVKYKHTTETMFNCEACNMGFKINGHLIRHKESRRHRNNMYGFTMKSKHGKE